MLTIALSILGGIVIGGFVMYLVARYVFLSFIGSLFGWRF